MVFTTRIQIELTYNSNRIEGGLLTQDQIQYIFGTTTIESVNGILCVDDVIEAANHFQCISIVIDNTQKALTETFIKKIHLTLMNRVRASRNDWYAIGKSCHSLLLSRQKSRK